MKIIELTAKTDLGKQRKDNQDKFICMPLWSDEQGLIGVIDGVGGYDGGEVAATIAKDSIEFYMSTPKGDALSMLKEAVVLANNEIVEAKDKEQKLAHMCCVLTVAVADAKNNLLYYAHVGDTRLYRFRNGILDKITKDHSLVGVREDAGVLTEEEAMQHPRRNIILRQIGTELHRIDDEEFLEFGEIEFLPGDTILICSDGLSDMITKDQIITALQEIQNFAQVADGLIALANDAGGNDNVTVVLTRNLSEQKSGPDPDELPAISTANIDTSNPNEQLSTEQNESVSTAEMVNQTSQGKTSQKFIILSLIAAVLLIFGFWLYNKPVTATISVKPPQHVTPIVVADSGLSRSPNNIAQAVSIIAPIDSLITYTHDRDVKELSLDKLKSDTIMLSHPIELGKIVRLTGAKNSSIVLIPDSLSKSKTALTILLGEKITGKRDTIFLKNLIINGFETGIHVEGHVVIRMDHVLFNEVKHAVSYRVMDSVKVRYLSF